MIKAIGLALVTLVLVPSSAAAGDKLYAELSADSSKSRALGEGRKILEEWLQAEDDLRDPKRQRDATRYAEKQRVAREEFDAWLAKTKDTLGTDLRTAPLTVLELFDEARVKFLNTKFARARIDYVKVDDPRGMDRLEYALWVPQKYNPKNERVPAVVSLHGRVINPKHPAFRGNAQRFLERSRLPLWNYWQESPAAEDVIVIAPTGLSDGFKFGPDDHYDNLQTLYRALDELLRNYRVDWNRVFLEVEGEALRIACEQTFVFAGFIVRERVDDRRSPVIPPEEFFMFENLNGVPLVYVADQKHWDKVGKPVADALTEAYKKAGAPENLLILQGQRDVNDALKGDEQAIQKFILEHEKPLARDTFSWRFWRDTMTSCLPLDLTGANFLFGQAAQKATLAEKAGALKYRSAVVEEEVEVDDGEGGKKKEKRTVNRIDIDVTEAESARLYLMEGALKFGLPLKIVVNGKTVAETPVLQRDWNLFWGLTVPRRYLMLPIFGRQDFQFDLKPQYEPPAPAANGGGTAVGDPPADGAATDANATGDAPAEGDGADGGAKSEK